jgi:hypothetical protein
VRRNDDLRGSLTARKGGAKKNPTGTQRKTAAEIVSRNAEIAELREVRQLTWSEIAMRFGIGVATAKRGYDDHIAGREYHPSFDQAMREMREYVAVLRRNQQALAVIAHDLPELDGAERRTPFDPRVRIAAIHEQAADRAGAQSTGRDAGRSTARATRRPSGQKSRFWLEA